MNHLLQVLVGAVLTVGAHQAFAAGNPNQPFDVTFDANLCPNPTTVMRLTFAGRAHMITLPGNRQITAFPDARTTVTNLSSGNSVSYVITGATHVKVQQNGNQVVTSTGRNLLIVPNANGHPAGLFLTVGTVTFVLDPAGNEVEVFSGTGRVVDVCQVLA
jgi:hypothetical protein